MEQAIAIVGIWIGVGMCGLNDKEGWTVLVAMFAVFATVAITK